MLMVNLFSSTFTFPPSSAMILIVVWSAYVGDSQGKFQGRFIKWRYFPKGFCDRNCDCVILFRQIEQGVHYIFFLFAQQGKRFRSMQWKSYCMYIVYEKSTAEKVSQLLKCYSIFFLVHKHIWTSTPFTHAACAG